MSHRRGRTRLLRVAELDSQLGEMFTQPEDHDPIVVVLHDRNESKRLIEMWLNPPPPKPDAMSRG